LAFFKKLYSYLYFHSWRLGVWTPPDRKILKDKILGYLAQNPRYKQILFVGVQDYCKDYRKMFSDREFYTIDPAPEVNRYGSTHHIIDVVQNIQKHLPEGFQFDAIVMNGVIGYGLNDHAEAEKTLQICKKLLRQEGLLIVGINPEQTGQVIYQQLPALKYFHRTTLPSLGTDYLNVRFPLYRDLSHSYYFYTSKE
jgi:hypothetical protein